VANPRACGLSKEIQVLARPAKAQEIQVPKQNNSLKNVTDEQQVHRFPVFSGIIAPPYDRVRKPS
jgi:glycerol kinase